MNYELAFWLVAAIAVLLLVLLLVQNYDHRGYTRFLRTALNTAHEEVVELREREAFAEWLRMPATERTRIPPPDPDARERKTIGM